MTKIFVIPDLQIKPNDDLTFISRIGNYITEKRPDVIVQIGDFADMQSLSSYDQGKKDFEGRRYTDDVECVIEAQIKLFRPLTQLQQRQISNKKKVYDPRTIITLGNHCNRINKAINSDRKLEGLISVKDLQFDSFFDEVYDFLDVVVVEGVAFSHYFTTGLLGRPCSSAANQLAKKHMSCVSGHQQGLQIATGHRADGKRLTSVIAGSCYEHDEGYLGPQGNKHWRGCIMLHSVKDGEFDMMPVSLDYLKEKYS